MSTVYVSLVLDNGEIVHIECPGKFEDELHTTLEHTMRRRDWWAPTQFDGCRAECFGLGLERVNMARVIGTL